MKFQIFFCFSALCLFFALGACSEVGPGAENSESSSENAANTEAGAQADDSPENTENPADADANDSENTQQNDGDSSTDQTEDGTAEDNPSNETEPENTQMDDDCESFDFALKPDDANVARVMLVVDRSYSMVIDGDRWTPMVESLAQVTDSLEDLVDFGLMVFPNPAAQMECAEGVVQLPPEPAQATNVNLVLSVHAPDQQYGGTPTAMTLEAAGAALLSANPEGGNNYILLATDGGPGCNYDLDYLNCECLSEWCWEMPANCLDDARTISTVLNLNLQGIKTFVVGIAGSEEFSQVLDQMAVAGGTDIDGAHHAVSNDIELGNALSTTTGSLVPCSYPLNEPVDDIDSLVVRIDGIVIQRDVNHENGWDLIEGILTLYGTACASLRDGEPHAVRAIYDCAE